MIINLLRFNNSEWVIIPNDKDVQSVVNLYHKLSLSKFKIMFQNNLVKDINGQPDLYIIRKMINKEDFRFEFYEVL